MVAVTPEEVEHHTDRGDRNQDERNPTPGKESKRGPRVVHEVEPHDLAENGERIAEKKVCGREPLRPLIQRHNEAGAAQESGLPSSHQRVAFGSRSCFS